MDKLKNDVPYLSISKNDHAKQYMSRINISTESFLSNELVTYSYRSRNYILQLLQVHI